MALQLRMYQEKVLWLAVATCTAFNGLLSSGKAAKPPTAENPWSLILYSDEVTPGNVLATQNLRKIQVVYFSFLELGAQALAREDSWFCVTAKTVSYTHFRSH